MNEDKMEMNGAVMKALQSGRWKGRVLVVVALTFGLLSIFASIVLAWASVRMVHPMERLLMEDYPQSVQQSGTNVEGKVALSRGELDWRHVQVTAAHGKVIFLTAVSVAFLGLGTFVTLLLVIFNRRVTLRQINASLAQISNQIKELQDGKSSDAKQ
jgi:hypothetical protein